MKSYNYIKYHEINQHSLSKFKIAKYLDLFQKYYFRSFINYSRYIILYYNYAIL